MTRISLLLLLTLLIGACTSQADDGLGATVESEPAPTGITAAHTPTASQIETTDLAQESPESAATATEDGADSGAAEPESSDEDDAQTELEVPPAITEEPQPSPTSPTTGSYEGTYFRGIASAPITMLDYSDFL